jgi:hypothetical protein
MFPGSLLSISTFLPGKKMQNRKERREKDY